MIISKTLNFNKICGRIFKKKINFIILIFFLNEKKIIILILKKCCIIQFPFFQLTSVKNSPVNSLLQKNNYLKLKGVKISKNLLLCLQQFSILR